MIDVSAIATAIFHKLRVCDSVRRCCVWFTWRGQGWDCVSLTSGLRRSGIVLADLQASLHRACSTLFKLGQRKQRSLVSGVGLVFDMRRHKFVFTFNFCHGLGDTNRSSSIQARNTEAKSQALVPYFPSETQKGDA
eukprot:501870-Amphidinium_carterae.1